ncbi:hypothetical protein [Bradyrhizobium retamae]|uniref:hypothetical protein n=1 Tax=Bradyrhizobium retamae TaxID=1300035 RepID=UPI0012E33459|nr:hypothetical protein [Bradyrhizobium retamae]
MPVLLRRPLHDAMFAAFRFDFILARLKRNADVNLSSIRRQHSSRQRRADRDMIATARRHDDVYRPVEVPCISAAGAERKRNLIGGECARERQRQAEYGGAYQIRVSHHNGHVAQLTAAAKGMIGGASMGINQPLSRGTGVE